MRLAILAVLALLVTACGGGGGDDSSQGLPDCSDVWVDGATLPKDYDGCMGGDGAIVAAVTIACDSGIGTFTTFEDRFHALLGGTITEAPSSSDEYGRAYRDCVSDPS